MGVKVTFSSRDEILGALVRALAVQAGGFQMAAGLTGDYLRKNGFYQFDLDKPQVGRFKILLRDYLRPDTTDHLKIMDN